MEYLKLYESWFSRKLKIELVQSETIDDSDIQYNIDLYYKYKKERINGSIGFNSMKDEKKRQYFFNVCTNAIYKMVITYYKLFKIKDRVGNFNFLKEFDFIVDKCAHTEMGEKYKLICLYEDIVYYLNVINNELNDVRDEFYFNGTKIHSRKNLNPIIDPLGEEDWND